jgi:hypothetical protein
MPCLNISWSLSESFCLAPSVEDVVAHLTIVVLGCNNLLLGLLVSGGM